MTLDQLRTFQAVATVRSFRGAADVLHITQPAISKQIQALEAELDERLFERGRSAQLTSAGTALLKHVEHLSRILAVAKEEITDLRELRAGHLSIGAAHSVATYVLPGLIEAYRARYPKVNLSIDSDWSVEITGRVMTYELDFGLLVLLSPKLQGFQQLAFVPLETTDLVFVTAPNNRLAGRKKITWDELKEAPWILNQHGCVYRSYIERRLKERGQVLKVEVEVMGLELQKKLTELGLGVSLLPRNFVTTELRQGSLKVLNVEVEVMGLELQKKLTELGLGVSLLPRNFVTRELRQGSLKVLNVEGTKLQGYSCLVIRRDKYIHGAMKGFLRLLQETFQPPKNGLMRYL